MALGVTHAFQSAVPASSDPNKVDGPKWNAGHVVQQEGERLLGKADAGVGSATEIPLSTGVEFSGGALRRSAITGDVSVPAGSNVATLATVNANVGSFGSVSAVATFTVDAKGRITAAANAAIAILAAAVTDFAAAVALIFRPLNVNGVAEPQLEIYADNGSTQANITATTHGLNGGGTFHGRHSRGTRALPTASQAGDIVGGIGSRCYHSGGAFQLSSPAAWHWQVTENQTGTAFGMWLRALTTPKGTTTRQERGGWTDVGTLWNHDTGTYDATSAAQTQPVADARFVASGDAAVASAGATFVAVTYGGSGNSTPGFRGMGARGTPASPTAIQADNFICFLGGHGYGATGFSAGTKALIGLKAAENWTDAAQGTYVTIETTPVGGTTRVERMRINDAGTMLIVNLAQTGYHDIAEISVPSDPAANTARFYCKDNGSGVSKLYFRDSAGTETEIGSGGGTAATQATMEAAASTTDFVTPGRQHFHPGHFKAGASFNGTGTPAVIRGWNTSSITDNNTGDYTMNWGITLSAATISTVTGCTPAGNFGVPIARPETQNSAGSIAASAATTTAMRITCGDSVASFRDHTLIQAWIHGDI